ncbi:signal peptidase I [Saccharothrix syringae]|uniref:Signal peptidase I n=1 Tax=Saccharothrix syringae TaxID=103733 RepID=A0A5Q0H960_SACSY|nr:signal peptidase I [Saccharothrix syringae]QFZ22756.1 signal peptidase I [Saccharothrix syringae]
MVDVAPARGPADGEDPGHEEKVERWRARARQKDKKKGSFWKELPILVGVAVLLAVLIQAFLAKIYMIPSESMEQTLHGCSDGCFGDRVLVDKLTYDFTDVEPGDVVVFHGPDAWVNKDFDTPEDTNPVTRALRGAASLLGFPSANEEDFVKRVIAVGGQTVKCCDDRNRVLVDGKPLDEPYVYWAPGRSTAQESFTEVKVPEGYIWVMGDNRNNSYDSRYQGGGGEAGAVPLDNVVGKARAIVLPPSRWQGVGDHNPQVVALGAPPWQDALPAGAGLAAAWPVLLVGRRVRARFRRPRLR